MATITKNTRLLRDGIGAIEVTLDYDDDGVIAEIRQGGQLLALGVALYEDCGDRNETAWEAVIVARSDLRQTRKKG